MATVERSGKAELCTLRKIATALDCSLADLGLHLVASPPLNRPTSAPSPSQDPDRQRPPWPKCPNCPWPVPSTGTVVNHAAATGHLEVSRLSRRLPALRAYPHPGPPIRPIYKLPYSETRTFKAYRLLFTYRPGSVFF